MQIYISKNKQQLGPFDEAKVLELLQRGHLSASDLGIRHGEKQWHPLGVLFPNFNPSSTSSAGFNVHPVTFETSKKARRRGLGVFMLVLGILIFLGGATTAVLRPTAFKSHCERAVQLLDEMKQAREKFELNKTDENLKEFESKRNTGIIWAKGCDEATSNYRFWMGVSVLAAIIGLLIMLIGFFKQR